MDTLTPKQRSERMRLIKSENTTPERVVKRIIRNYGVRHRSHVSYLPGHPDIVISSKRKIVLVHGCFWHRHNCKAGRRLPKTHLGYWNQKFKRNRQRDSEVIKQLHTLGWQLLVIWECQLRNLERLDKRIRDFLVSQEENQTGQLRFRHGHAS